MKRGESLLSIVDSAGGLIPYFIFLQTPESGALNLLSLSPSVSHLAAPASLLPKDSSAAVASKGLDLVKTYGPTYAIIHLSNHSL